MTESASHEVRVGEVVAGKYRVDRVIGQGGMGLVVLATHEQLDQRVALKFLLPSFANEKEIVERFLREARAAVKISSEHVARVFDVGTHEGVPFMVMEFLEGSDLGDLIAARGAIPLRDAAGYLIEACDAVAEAHSLGIVHRDLKPANLFLANRPSGKPIIKVLDFGISKIPTSEKDRALTNATAIMGSPSYMSPEQLVASATVDARSDVWSLGVVLYEMLSAKLPFHAESMPELVGVILQKTFVPIENVSPAVQEILARCLQKDRETRFSSVAELARALLPLASPRYAAVVDRIDGVLGLASPESGGGANFASVRAAPSSHQQTFAPTTTAPTKSSSSKLVVALLVFVAVFGIGSVIVWTQIRRSATPDTVTIATATTVTTSATATTTSVATTVVPAPIASEVMSATSQPTVSATASPHVHGIHVPPSAAPSASAPGCKTVSFYDANGNKHFKLECP